METTPHSLRIWFFIHFVLDMVFGLPLLFAPAFTLSLFNFSVENLLLARLVGAALFGIGGISLIAHKTGKETFRHLLNLKLLWSGAALFGIALSIAEGMPRETLRFVWIFLGIFIFFFVLWGFYRFRLR